jgi:hypothetical protein
MRKGLVAGTYELQLRGSAGCAARTAKLEVRFGTVTLPQPSMRSPWLRQCGIASITQWVVEVREVAAPRGVKPLHWVLYTSHAIESFDDAWRVITYYEKRWLIEEFHKALKTGCRLEERQIRHQQASGSADGTVVGAVVATERRCPRGARATRYASRACHLAQGTD